MVNYSNGKIYKIVSSLLGDEGDVYIGSTTKILLSMRMSNHRSDYKRWQDGKLPYKTTVYNLFEKYGVCNCQVVLIEEVNATSKDELQARERHYIQALQCVNKVLKSPYSKIEQCRIYRDEHKDRINEIGRQRYQRNKQTSLL